MDVRISAHGLKMYLKFFLWIVLRMVTINRLDCGMRPIGSLGSRHQCREIYPKTNLPYPSLDQGSRVSPLDKSVCQDTLCPRPLFPDDDKKRYSVSPPVYCFRNESYIGVVIWYVHDLVIVLHCVNLNEKWDRYWCFHWCRAFVIWEADGDTWQEGLTRTFQCVFYLDVTLLPWERPTSANSFHCCHRASFKNCSQGKYLWQVTRLIPA